MVPDIIVVRPERVSEGLRGTVEVAEMMNSEVPAITVGVALSCDAPIMEAI